ncbi:transposase [Endozoicomonas sp. 8E]|uniref:IS91 family transposase n=1 Tax=Endozoicomonas sp. 8E TaxID=3035692 RepID=UPI0029393353|nr:transposase [Endozoicomonas sp. 8E]WOG25906.1 transposase [Endozoicomonas sp. 8E]
MERSEQIRFDKLYQKHITTLKLQGKRKSTIDLYSRPLRRLATFFDRCPDRLSPEDLKTYFAALVESHSWSTVKTDRNGLQFFWKHVLGKHWDFVEIIKPPTVKRLPVILTPAEVERLLNTARKLRYYTILLTLYGMGLRLAEGLNLTIADIDSELMRVHLRIHFVVPGGGINTRRKEWRKLTGNYLFNGKNLAMVFRAKLLRALDEQELLSPSLKTRLPIEWVVNCKRVGKGLPALEYLSRYLYRGVISDTNILASKRGKVTFSYLNSETGKKEKRTLPGEDFLWLVLKHVLPRRLRRSRDYGFLRSNAKKQLSLVQLVLNVMVKAVEPVIRPKFTCRHGESMKHIAFSFVKPT